VFRALGAGEARTVPFASRRDGECLDLLDALAQATGIFLTGGEQLRLSTTLGGTSAAMLLRHLNAEGVPVAGTSAGASYLSEHMIASGRSGGSPRVGSVTMAPGLGLTNRVVIDQHFRQRDRLGRLLAAVALNPFAVGAGLDEDTAVFIGPGDVMEVVGTKAVTIVDGSGLELTSLGNAGPRAVVSLIGARVHVLVQGSTFDLRTRRASPGSGTEVGRLDTGRPVATDA
jgi:cyanophycinase